MAFCYGSQSKLRQWGKNGEIQITAIDYYVNINFLIS